MKIITLSNGAEIDLANRVELMRYADQLAKADDWSERATANAQAVICALLAEVRQLARPRAPDLALDSILAAARAAKQEAGSGEWLIGPAFTRHSEGRTWTARDVGTVGGERPLAENCLAAVAAHIAVADPDTVITLVEQLQRAEADRDTARAMLDAVTAARDAAKAHAAEVERDRDERLAALHRGEQHGHTIAADLLAQLGEASDQRAAAQWAVVALNARNLSLEAEALRLKNRAADTERDLWQLVDDIDEHLPRYARDDGTDDEAGRRERVEYAGREIRQLRALDAEHTALVEAWWDAAVSVDNYEANHGARCDAEQERYATIAESACRMLGREADRLDAMLGTNELSSRIRTFLSLPSHEVPGLRAKVAARDGALDACAARIRDLLAEGRTLRRHRDIAEIWSDRFRGLADVQAGILERAGARLADAERDRGRMLADLRARILERDRAEAELDDLRGRVAEIENARAAERAQVEAGAAELGDRLLGAHYENRALRRWLSTAETFVESFRGLCEVQLGTIERFGARIARLEAALVVAAERLAVIEASAPLHQDGAARTAMRALADDLRTHIHSNTGGSTPPTGGEGT